MKNQSLIFTLLLVVSILICGCESEQSIWKKTLETNSIEGFEGYLLKYPEGSFIDSAQIFLIDLYFENAGKTEDIQEYTKVIERFDNSIFSHKVDSIATIETFQIIQKDTSLQTIQLFISEILNIEVDSSATQNNESFNFDDLKRKYNIKAYEEFINKYPQNAFVEKASTSLMEFRWEEALKANTVKSFQMFKTIYPDSEYEKTINDKIVELENTFIGEIQYANFAAVAFDGIMTLGGGDIHLALILNNNPNTIFLLTDDRAILPRGKYKICSLINTRNFSRAKKQIIDGCKDNPDPGYVSSLDYNGKSIEAMEKLKGVKVKVLAKGKKSKFRRVSRIEKI